MVSENTFTELDRSKFKIHKSFKSMAVDLKHSHKGMSLATYVNEYIDSNISLISLAGSTKAFIESIMSSMDYNIRQTNIAHEFLKTIELEIIRLQISGLTDTEKYSSIIIKLITNLSALNEDCTSAELAHVIINCIDLTDINRILKYETILLDINASGEAFTIAGNILTLLKASPIKALNIAESIYADGCVTETDSLSPHAHSMMNDITSTLYYNLIGNTSYLANVVPLGLTAPSTLSDATETLSLAIGGDTIASNSISTAIGNNSLQAGKLRSFYSCSNGKGNDKSIVATGSDNMSGKFEAMHNCSAWLSSQITSGKKGRGSSSNNLLIENLEKTESISTTKVFFSLSLEGACYSSSDYGAVLPICLSAVDYDDS